MPLDPRLASLNNEAIKNLRKSHHRHDLVVAVGAGASKQSGLPTWAETLEGILVRWFLATHSATLPSGLHATVLQNIASALEKEHPLMVAHYLRSGIPDDDFLNMVHSTLYDSLQSMPVPGDITSAVARLAPDLKAIITFNYDNLIEEALQLAGVSHTSVWREEHLDRVTGTPVYHPHGYLPYQRNPSERYWIALSEYDYHTQYKDSANWGNQAVSKALTASTCLFVSTSMTDPNVRRILDLARRQRPDSQHYFVWSRADPDTLTPQELINEQVYHNMFVDGYSRLGLHPLWFYARDHGNRWADVPDLLDAIA